MLDFVISLCKYFYYSRKFSRVDFFSYSILANPKFVSPKYFVSVFLYGNYKAIARLRHKRFNFFTEYLEHGTYYLDNPDSAEQMGYINRKGIRKVYTYSERRKKVLEQYVASKGLTRQIIPVGPYILGSSNFLSIAKREQIKARYGKILLVFPSHSIEHITSEYNNNVLIQEIERIKSDFDSVWMCFYWMDILHQKHEEYEQAGYTIVSAGHRSDPNFLPRLKDIIELSDCTMSNNVGTHIGYCICLNRPHYFYHQELLYTIAHASAVETEKVDARSINLDFHRVFGTYSQSISTPQIELIREYWGNWK